MRLLESIEARDVAGARDRALIAVMLFSFARVGALVGMRVKDYHGAGSSAATFTLHETSSLAMCLTATFRSLGAGGLL